MWLVVNPLQLGKALKDICISATEASVDEFMMRSTPDDIEKLMPDVFENERQAKAEATFRLTLLTACPDVDSFLEEMTKNRRSLGLH